MNRCSLSSDSRLWWLPAATAGLAASGFLAAALVVVPCGGATAEPWSPWDTQPGYAHVPTDDIQRGSAHTVPKHCPPPPDPAYVGGPWVAPHSECATLRHWWTFVG